MLRVQMKKSQTALFKLSNKKEEIEYGIFQ